jgi:hypothetical protein
MVKDRCDKYKDDNTFGFGKNYVYKHCKRCPQKKTWKINKYNTPGFKPAIFTIGNSCHDTEKLNAELRKRNKKKKKVSEKCVYYKQKWKYGKGSGYPCKGIGEREYRKYLDDEVNEWINKKKRPFKKNETIKLHRMGNPMTKKEYIKHCDYFIRYNSNKRKKKLKELNDFYKSQNKKVDKTKKRTKRK